MSLAMKKLMPGFDDPVAQSQHVFRRVLEAMSRPGRILSVEGIHAGPAGLSPAALSVCLALADFETPLWLDAKAQAAREYLAFHCGCPIAPTPDAATFALLADPTQLDIDAFNPGSDEYPERSTTLILEVHGMHHDGGAVLRGPGIEDHARLFVDGVAADFWQQLQANHARFPRGVDIILAHDRWLAALPRSTRVEV